MNGIPLPLTNYDVDQIKKALKIASISIAAIFLITNISTAIFIKKVKADPKDYVIKNGFPLFVSAKEYISLVKSYPHDMGTKIRIHTMRSGESYWDVARNNRISVDAIVSANPFLTSLVAREGMEIVVPAEDGVLQAMDDFYDSYRMSKILKYRGRIMGEYFPSIFRLFKPDDTRFAFFKNASPFIVNDSLQSLYNLRRIFQNPVHAGIYSSLYGDRIDPMRDDTAFHNGLDIPVKMGTPIFPARDGIVTYTGWLDGYGLTVTIQHPEGYVTMYGHCASVKIKKGDFVTKDECIGLVGSTGRSTGPHLHFMVMRHGRMINPLLFIW